MFIPPLSRQRLYTTVSMYSSLVWDAVVGKVYREEKEVQLLESELRHATGTPYALAVNQNRVGLYCTIRALVQDGRRNIILSPFTIFDVVNMVVCAGGRPIFADVKRESCSIDVAEVERLIDEETAAVLVTHTHVLAEDIDSIVEICRLRNIALVEDAAVAFGTRHGGRAVGTLGDVGIYSFGLFKNISAFFGGAVVTRHHDLYEKIRQETREFVPLSIRALMRRALYGALIDVAVNPTVFRLFTYWVFRFGFLHDVEFINKMTRNDPNPVLRQSLPDAYKRRMTDAQARIIMQQLSNVRQDMEERLEITRFYQRELRHIPEILLPPVNEGRADAFLVFPIQVTRRDELLRHLMCLGRDCASHYYKNCTELSCFSEFSRECPNARRVAETVVLLPTYPGYGLKEAERNVRVIRGFFGS